MRTGPEYALVAVIIVLLVVVVVWALGRRSSLFPSNSSVWDYIYDQASTAVVERAVLTSARTAEVSGVLTLGLPKPCLLLFHDRDFYAEFRAELTRRVAPKASLRFGSVHMSLEKLGLSVLSVATREPWVRISDALVQ